MQERKEYKPSYRYTATRDENGNYCINKNGELLCIYNNEFGIRYFEAKVIELSERGIFVEDML